MNERAEQSLLRGARVYLSGPMDFVASRADEKRYGWRNRIGEFLTRRGVTVFDPWFKPEVRGFHEYGREGEETSEERQKWSFEDSEVGAQARGSRAAKYWETLHVDLRMVDTSDFVIAYCPTNIYSVGTPHEIVVAREQHKPVLFVSPAVDFPALAELQQHLNEQSDDQGLEILERLQSEVPIKANPKGIPSLWYMALVSTEHFFDGFGFDGYKEEFGWPNIALDDHEAKQPPKKPLLPFLERLSHEIPHKWDTDKERYVPDDDWVLWDLDNPPATGSELRATYLPSRTS